MNKTIAILALLGCFLPACGLENRFGDREAAQRACLDRARDSGHRVRDVISVTREGRDQYRVMLDVDPANRPAGVTTDLTCEYDEPSRTATNLHW